MSPLLERRREEASGTLIWVRRPRFSAEKPEGGRVPVFSFFEELFRARLVAAAAERQKISAG